jgi:glutathione synthase/RimK-type ligase-like ATP-grasp enzyme
VKLILANNQSERFTAFYASLQAKSSEPFDYAGYDSLLFSFNVDADHPLTVRNLAQSRDLTQYDGVYINGYLNTYELAATVAISCDALGIGYINRELHQPASLSKLSMHAKLAAARVPTPPTIAGTKHALLQAADQLSEATFPAVLKRADADRGIDNYKVQSFDEVAKLLQAHTDRSLWLLQEFVPNNGFYLLSFYEQMPKFCIFRSLESRPDGNVQKAHMYKPKGGKNASLIDVDEVPEAVVATCQKALIAMDRQIGSIDCLYDANTGEVHILEVNYNPQLVTIETFKEARIEAFLQYLPNLGKDLEK